MDTQNVTQQAANAVTHAAPTWSQRVAQAWQQLSWDSVGLTGSGKWLPEQAEWLPIGMWFGAGFAIGFLTKKYSKSALGVLAVALCLLIGLEYGNFIIVNWPVIKQTIGAAPDATLGTLLRGVGTMARDNFVLCVTGIGGFVLGHHLG